MIRQLSEMENLFKALADSTRLRILGLLLTGDGLWVQYRLASPSDLVARTIADAVGHGLTHIDVVRRDAERLQEKTGCCVPATEGSAGLPCCESSGGRVLAVQR